MKFLVVCVIALAAFSSTVDSVPVYSEATNEPSQAQATAVTTLSPADAIAALQKKVTDLVVSVMKSLGNIKEGANQKVIDAKAAVAEAKETKKEAEGSDAEEAAKSSLNEAKEALREAKFQDNLAKKAYRKAKERSSHIWFEF